MTERLKNEPNSYSSQEVVERVKSVLIHVRDELAGQFKSELVGDWHHWLLRVDLGSSDTYRAIVAYEDSGKVIYIFEPIRLWNDGEVLYRGCSIDDDHPQLYLELVAEAKRQHDWAKRRQEIQMKTQKELQLSGDTLRQLREEYPKHAQGILVHSQQDCTFSLTLSGLTPDRLRELIRVFDSIEVVQDDKSNRTPAENTREV